MNIFFKLLNRKFTQLFTYSTVTAKKNVCFDFSAFETNKLT